MQIEAAKTVQQTAEELGLSPAQQRYESGFGSVGSVSSGSDAQSASVDTQIPPLIDTANPAIN